MSMSIYNKNILPDWNCGHKCEVNYKVHRSQTGVINIFFVQAKLNDLKNARLADVCIGTSAAPTFLHHTTLRQRTLRETLAVLISLMVGLLPITL
jgi:hypothetical protein